MMECSNRQTGSCGCVRRPQLQPSFGNTDFGRSLRMAECFSMPIGMGYVPWQKWGQTYSMEQGLKRGTIFPELDYPFTGGGICRDVQ